MRRFFALSSLALLALSSCITSTHDHEEDFHGVEPEPTGEISFAVSVAQAASAGGCSTTVVFGLSEQINEVVNCMKPGILVAIPDRPNFKKSASTFAYMEKPAVDGLIAALDERTDMTLNANSILRNIASQYLLRSWFEGGQCGITAAAQPAQSNHETGQAIDTSDHAAWLTTLEKHGFKWLGSGDVVHFDYVGAGTVDLRPTEVEAFQRLWNHNNPTDKIAEDGAYGPMTEARLTKSPADGFASVPPCNPGTGGAGGAGGTGAAGMASAGKAGAATAGSGGAKAGSGGTASGGTASGGTASGGTASGGTASGGTASGGTASGGTAGQGAAGEPGAGGAAQAGSTASGGSTSAGAAGSTSAGAGGGADLVISRDDGGANGGCGCEVPRARASGAEVVMGLGLGLSLLFGRRRRKHSCTAHETRWMKLGRCTRALAKRARGVGRRPHREKG